MYTSIYDDDYVYESQLNLKKIYLINANGNRARSPLIDIQFDLIVKHGVNFLIN